MTNLIHTCFILQYVHYDPLYAQVERKLQFSINLCTGRPLTESDDTRCCINTIQPPDDEHMMLKTRRGL